MDNSTFDSPHLSFDGHTHHNNGHVGGGGTKMTTAANNMLNVSHGDGDRSLDITAITNNNDVSMVNLFSRATIEDVNRLPMIFPGVGAREAAGENKPEKHKKREPLKKKSSNTDDDEYSFAGGPSFKVNISDTQKRFLSELVYLFFYDIIKRFPESIQIQLIANYFTMMYRKKALLCVFQLRNFGKGKLSNLDYIAYTVNEKYLLHEVEIAT